MSTPSVPEVRVPFFKKKVPVVVDLDQHPAMERIAKWGPVLKKQIEVACFANYKNKVAAIGQNPSLPQIRTPNEIWKHLEVQNIRIDACGTDAIVVYVVPAWDIDLQMEWCIHGDNLVYVGQFLQYPVDAYSNCRDGNTAMVDK